MRVDRKRQVKADQRAAKNLMEAERQASAMKAEIQAVAVELAFQISYWLQISFRFIPEC